MSVARLPRSRQSKSVASFSSSPGVMSVGSRSPRRHLLASAGLATALGVGVLGLTAVPALGQLPTGGQVVAGDVTIGAGMTVYQSSATGIVNWDSFSIGVGNQVGFANGSGATLNRVVGTDVSAIMGQLTGTGSVYLINQNGIVIGDTGRIDVGGDFVASTLDTTNDDWLGTPASTVYGDGTTVTGSVINRGYVTTGGILSLVGSRIENDGVLLAHPGGGSNTAYLSSGLRVRQIAPSGDEEPSVPTSFRSQVVDANTADVSIVGPGIIQDGTINYGSVRLEALGNDTYDIAIDHSGETRAQGDVWLLSSRAEGDGSLIRVAGGVDDRSRLLSEDGDIYVTSNGPAGQIEIDHAELSALGGAGRDIRLLANGGSVFLGSSADEPTVDFTETWEDGGIVTARTTELTAEAYEVVNTSEGLFTIVPPSPDDLLPRFGTTAVGYIHGYGDLIYSDGSGEDGYSLTIDQHTTLGVIEWDEFSIGEANTVWINNHGGATLNRVIGADISRINGSLFSDGSVYLVNENGIVIGNSGIVETDFSFVASTLPVETGDWVNGGVTYWGDNTIVGGQIENHGEVTSGHHIGFMAPHIVNTGELRSLYMDIFLNAGLWARHFNVEGGVFHGQVQQASEAHNFVGGTGIVNEGYLITQEGNIYLDAQGGSTYDQGVDFSGQLTSNDFTFIRSGFGGGTTTGGHIGIHDAFIESGQGRLYITAAYGGSVDIADTVITTSRDGGGIAVDISAQNGHVDLGSLDGEATVDFSEVWSVEAIVQMRAATYEATGYNVDYHTGDIYYITPPDNAVPGVVERAVVGGDPVSYQDALDQLDRFVGQVRPQDAEGEEDLLAALVGES